MRLSSLFRVGVICLLATLAACEADGPIAPSSTWTLSPSLEMAAADAPPDSGEVVIHPYDGPTQLEEGGAVRALALTVAQPRIRIGVVQSATAITLGSAGGYEIRDKASNMILMSGPAGAQAATVTIVSAPATFLRLQVVCGNATAVASLKAAAEALGHVTLTEFFPGGNCTRLYLGQFAPPPANTTAARTAFRNLVISQGLAGTDSFYRTVTIGVNTIYRVARGSTQLDNVNPVVVTSSTGLVLINGGTYRDRGEARINSGGTLAGINELPMEQYLYGVVPRELGPIAFPEVEAQKAQSVAARTFAVAGLGRRGSDGYDLRATTDDQVYGGYVAEHPVSSAAVDATAGVVLTDGGKLISALYHSTSGGHTADNEEAFNGVPASYLRGVPDAQRGKALEHVPSLSVFKAHANPRSLRAAREGDFESDWASLHRWTFEWTMDEISSVISAFAQQPVGKVTAINVLERGPSGRVLRIEYVTEGGTFTSTKDQVRASLRFINASGNPANLPSTLFFVEPIEERASGDIVGYRAYGGGFGHGVGMSQTGAVGMAEKGRPYDEILRHYYREVDLVKWYE